MKVLVIFEYDDIHINQEGDVDLVIQNMSEECEIMATNLGADNCYIQEIYESEVSL